MENQVIPQKNWGAQSACNISSQPIGRYLILCHSCPQNSKDRYFIHVDALAVALIPYRLTDSETLGMVRPAPLVWVFWGVAIASYNLIKANRQVRR